MIMKKNQLRGWVLVIGVLFILGSCEKAGDEIVKNDLSPAKKEFASTANENASLNSADRDEGFVHYHEFVSTNDGRLHPSKVVWLKHTAVTSFTLDGGPGAPNPPYEHEVTPGVDLLFPNNYMEPYDPQDPHDH
jgi:hypothetical protein